ncbi:VCBS repeat-containing protein [Nonomuraea sp. NPDC050556]|uniref:VCBS repeat-containing protein n=1 Tax=Nonomuraea sp. NPDC050556 TaxID=3364369 RepID=UPI0037878B17
MKRAVLAIVLVTTACTQTTDNPAKPADCAKASAHDFDGDGRDDVAIGDPWVAGGAVRLLTAGKVVKLPSPELGAHDGFGAALTFAKVDGDGCADLVVGAPYADVGGKEAGAVYILYGGAARPPQRITARQPKDGATFGWSLAAHGDVIAIGAPHENAVHLARRGTVERTITQDTMGVPGDSDPLDQFGTEVALGPMASGKVALAVGAPYEGEVGAVTVIDDVNADRLSGAMLTPPKIDDGGLCEFGQSLVHIEGVGLAVGGADCGKVQFYDLDLHPSRTVARPRNAPKFEPVRLASTNGQAAALWPGPSPTLRLLGKGDLKASETARSVTFLDGEPITMRADVLS